MGARALTVQRTRVFACSISGRGHIEVLAYLAGEKVIDLSVTGDGGGLSGDRIDEDRVAGALAE